MKKILLAGVILLNLVIQTASYAQPSSTAAFVAQPADADSSQRRAGYQARVHEMLTWGISTSAKVGSNDLVTVAAQLALKENLPYCSKKVIELMGIKEPGQKGNGPFWMFPVTTIAFLGKDVLSNEAKQAIREAWRVNMQTRGDTENHWAMYYSSLYLMSELYPHEPENTWYNGKSSDENLHESKEYLINWMNIATSIGQGEFNVPNYIAEYAIPMAMLATWAKDPEMKKRGQMMLEWIYSDFAANTLQGVIHGPNARADDISIVEPWNCMASNFAWLLFGNTPPTRGYSGWGVLYASIAQDYELPEVIYKIARSKQDPLLQEDLKRTRRRWRNIDVLMAPVYKTNYMTQDYAVGSYQGGLVDPIQTHGWDIMWNVGDPRGVHNTMFSMNPISSTDELETCFTAVPDEMPKRVMQEGKPSYDFPGKLLGSSRYEQIYQNLDTIVALYDIPEGTRFPHINGFFSKDLTSVTIDKSGWIFAKGGNTYLAYRPLADYTFQPISAEKSWLPGTSMKGGDKRLYSPHLKNGTILQVASAKEFKDFEAFKERIRSLPFVYRLEPKPTVSMTTIRGNRITCTFGQEPILNGNVVDYTQWKLFQGTYLNADKNAHKLTITHGNLRRVLDFNSVTTQDN